MLKKIISITIFLTLHYTALCNSESCGIEEQENIISLQISLNKTQILKPTNEDYSQPGKRIERMYTPGIHYPPQFIVLHYTVTKNIKQTVNAFYNAGVSAHFTIDRDGTIYENVPFDEDNQNIAFHAGQSFWRGKYHLNSHSVGIEQINTGNAINKGIWEKHQSPAKEADREQWETLSTEQIIAVANLVRHLIEEYDIKPWNIIGHSDCSCGRKTDPGPLFPWKKLHDEHGIGIWPSEDDETITKESAEALNHEDYIYLLHAIGYPIHNFISSVENIEELQ